MILEFVHRGIYILQNVCTHTHYQAMCTRPVCQNICANTCMLHTETSYL